MGVRNLWPELSDGGEANVPVYSLEGKTVAIDLSSWIVELRNIDSNQKFGNLYIRNLFYRITDLLRNGIKMVVVADGKAPELKLESMKKRQFEKFGTTCENTNREWFRLYSIKCEELLRQMGVPFLHSPGEGEALCAALSNAGLVDGVMTNDADAFLYGAKTVYRNYKIDRAVFQTSIVDEYCMEDIEGKLNITRRGMIFVALLAGCDLDLAGVGGVGPKKGIALLQEYKKLGIDPLDRMFDWRTNQELIELEAAEETPHCSACKHSGDREGHGSTGCNICGTTSACTPRNGKTCPCLWHKRKQHDLELWVRRRALTDPEFPNKQLIDEYLSADKLTEDIDESKDLAPKPIRLPELRMFMRENFHKLGEFFYVKIAPILADMQLIKMTDFLTEELTLKPLRIVRNCKKAGQVCMEVEWQKLAEDQETQHEAYKFPVDSERFTEAFPDMVEEFNASRGKKRKGDYLNKEEEPGQQDMKSYFKVTKN